MNHSLWRDRTTQARYKKYVATKPIHAPCEFCHLRSADKQVVSNENGFWVATNIYPYTIWDSFFVKEHLMLIPKRHVDSIGSFKTQELNVFADIVARYERDGFSIYGRSANNGAKSIAHQHTHLIKVSERKVKVLVYLRKFGITFFR